MSVEVSMSEETIKRVGDFKYEPDDFEGVRVQTFHADLKLTKNAPTDSAYLWRHGLVVRHSTNKAALVTVDTVAAAAIEMARDIPAMRAALLEALTAMGPAEGGAATVGG